MKIGVTYDLRSEYLALGLGPEETAEFDSEATIEGIARALCGLGFRVERIGSIRRLAERLVQGERFDLVFNIAEGLAGIGREAQVPALLDAYGIPYTFSDPFVLSLTLHKAMTKRVLRDAGVPTAPFAMVEREADVAGIDLPYPLFAKPVAEGSGKGIDARSRVETPAALLAACRALLARFRQPVLVETYLPGREFTVGITGSGEAASPIGVMEVLLGPKAEPGVYSFENKEEYEDRVAYRLVDDAEARAAAEVALSAWRVLGCRDGGRIDIRSGPEGRPQFIEVNPLAGINPERSDLVILARLAGVGYEELIGRIMASALSRLGLPMPARTAAAA